MEPCVKQDPDMGSL